MDHLRNLHNEYAGRAAFFFVYVSEAGHDSPQEGPLRRFPLKVDHAQRREAVRQSLKEMKFPFPCLIDRANAEVEKLYDARPLRLVVVGVDGRILYGAGGRFEERWHLGEVKKCLDDALAARKSL